MSARRGFSAVLAAIVLGTWCFGQDAGQPDPQVERLERRLEQNAAADFEPAFVDALRGLAEYRKGLRQPKRRKYIPVADGSVAPNTMALFQWLNPEWEILEGGRDHWATAEDIVATVVDVERQLASAGVELIVAPVPDRLMLYPELVAPYEVDEGFVGFGPGFTRFQLALLAAGIQVVDLLEPLARARQAEPGGRDADLVYLRTNSHWSPLGAAVGARVVADRLREGPWMEGLHRAEASTRLERVQIERLEANSEGLPETFGDFEFDRVVDSAGELVPNTDPDSPLLVLGDSYTRIFSLEGCDFARHLHHHLGFAPDVIASPGGGAISSRRMLARRPEPLAGKRVVLWLFTVRALIEGPKQWRQITIVGE